MTQASEKAFLIQIGFNKCATSALQRLFSRSGYKALHSGGRTWRLEGHPAVTGYHPQQRIADNLDAGRPPLDGLEDFDAFFDMTVGTSPPREHHLDFDRFAEAYPNAKFLLNTRDIDDWLRSRARHFDGQFLQWAMDHTGKDKAGVFAMWRDSFQRHHERVRNYFAGAPERFLEFDIKRSDIHDLIAFARPRFRLKPKHWRQVRVTDSVAARKQWKDLNR